MSELEKPIIEYPDSYPPEACEDIAYRDERIKELEAERDRLREALQEIERTCISPSHVEKLAQKALEETT